MNKQPRMIDADTLRSKVQLKIEELNKRIEARRGICHADESETIERLNCEAHAYEQVIKMIEQSVDPIPLPTIKPGDRVEHALYGIGKVEYKGKFMSAILFEKNGGKPHVSLDVFNESLELIPNE